MCGVPVGKQQERDTKITTMAEFLENLGERKMAAELAEAARTLKGTGHDDQTGAGAGRSA